MGWRLGVCRTDYNTAVELWDCELPSSSYSKDWTLYCILYYYILYTVDCVLQTVCCIPYDIHYKQYDVYI